MSARKRVAVLISGRGSNLRSLLAAASAEDFPAEIVLVVSNRADAGGLAIAAEFGVPSQVIGHRGFASRAEHEQAIDAALMAAGVELVCLAGYMRLLTAAFVARWAGRMINVHPSLLPAFKGLDTHGRALAAGCRIHGATVHFVTADMDDGPIIAQAAVPVLAGDDPDALAARVLAAEHRIYPLALRLVAEGAISLGDDGRLTGSGTERDPDAMLISAG